MLIVLGVTLVAVSSGLSASTHTCNGTVGFSILYEDGQIRNVSVDGVSGSATDKETITPNPDALQRLRFTRRESFAGENGIEIDNERFHILLIPGRTSGYVVHLFNYVTKAWSTIAVYCQPSGIAYRPESDEIVGFCRVNTTYYDGTITCVPYFVLRMENDEWVDVSRSGLCSQPLSTANITNPVILQGDTDIEFDAVRLYFGERGTNRLHEVSLSVSGGSNFYDVDGATLKIDRLFQASNSSLRVTCYTENSSDFYQKSFLWQTETQPQQTGFTSGSVLTESTAFDSYNLNYLVTFSASRNTVIIIKDGESQSFQLSHALDDPSQCQNLVGPATHYLICLAENGHLPLLINITNNSVTNQTLPVDEFKRIVKTGMLTENIFYLLNDQQELSVYLITTMVICVGVYTVRSNTNFIITCTSSDIINCTIMEEIDLDTDEPRSVPVVAIVVSIIAVVVSFGILFIVVVWWQIKKKDIRNQKKHYKDPESHDTEDNNSITTNNCNEIISEDTAQATTENDYTVLRAARANKELTNSTHVNDKEEIQESGETAQDGCNEVSDDHDRDETDHGDDNDGSTNVLASVQSNSHTISTSSLIERDSSLGNANNERNNLEVVSGCAPDFEPNPNVKPFESSAKCDNFENFELQSSQPVPFVGAMDVITPVPTTKENEYLPAPAVERMDS